MSTLLEIFGRGVKVDTAELIWHWLDTDKSTRFDIISDQQHQIKHIVSLLSEGRLNEAQEQLRLYLFENPSCPRGRMAAAAICLCKNKLQEAIQELNSVYMRQPSNTMALYALGHCYERLGKEPEAIEFYQDCLKFNSSLQLPAQRLAAIYFKNGSLEKATEQYELLRQHYPDDIHTLVILGYLYMAGSEYSKAINAFNTSILIHPDNFLFEDNCLDQLIRSSRLNEALDHIENLLEHYPDRPELLSSRAHILSLLGANAEAVSTYQQLLRICPDFLEATVNFGTLYLKMGADQLAAEQFNRAVEINDKIVDSYIGLAMAQKLAGYTTDSLTTLSLASSIQPNSSFLFAQTAILIFKSCFTRTLSIDSPDDQLRIFHAIVDFHRQQIIAKPQNPDPLYRLGLLLMSHAKFDYASNAFQSALDINSSFSKARIKLAICLFGLGFKHAALDHLNLFFVNDFSNLNLYYKIALLYCDQVKFASSLLNLDFLLHRNLAPADTTANISIVLSNLGLLDRVFSMWENLSEMAKHTCNTNISFS